MSMVVTVSQVNRRLSLLVKGDKQLQDISVKGEICDFVKHFKSGHIYFKLRDDESSIKVVMFRNNADSLDYLPENGMNVVVRGNIQLYERDGACQLYAADISRDEGVGEGLLSFEQLKQKLLDEGLFEQKRALPKLPKSICIVTSETGAAVKDIINVLSRRYPFIRAVLIPVTVQGAEAAASIAKGIEKAQQSGCDVIIFGRGGGSSEDLSPFNSELVARAVYNSKIPTISAVGHEIDFTISDFVADMRAPTPSAAAEIAVPDINALRSELENIKRQIKEKAQNKIFRSKEKYDELSRLITHYNPLNRIEANSKAVQGAFSVIQKDFCSLVLLKESQLNNIIEKLNAFDPLKTLERGYSIVFMDGGIVSSAKAVQKGEKINVKMADGEFDAVVTDTVHNTEGS